MRIELVKDAVKNLVVDVLPTKNVVEDAWLRFREGISGAFKESRTVYVATFWHVDSMSGIEWNINHMPVRTVFEDWKKDLIADGNAGVVGLFKVKLPVYINMTDSESINEYLDLMDDNGQFPRQGVVLDQNRQHMTEEEGF